MQKPEVPFLKTLDFSGIPSTAWVLKPQPLSRQRDAETSNKAFKLSASDTRYVSSRLVTKAGRDWLKITLVGNFLTTVTSSWADVLLPLAMDQAGPPYEILLPSESPDLRVFGQFGLHELGGSDLENVYSSDGKWYLQSITGDRIINLPPMDLPASRINWKLLANGGEATILESFRRSILTAAEPSYPTGQVRIFRASSKKWETLAIAGPPPIIKLIDNWIMGIQREEPNGRISPGHENRRSVGYKQEAPRPDIDATIKNSGSYYPGVLFLIETGSGKMITISTGEGDSEILYVRDNSTVYYRVNDRILSAPIRGSSIGPPTELARGNELRDVHWAFFGR